MKKFSKIILCILIISIMFGCTAQKESVSTTQTSTQVTVSESLSSQTEKSTTQIDTTSEETSKETTTKEETTSKATKETTTKQKNISTTKATKAKKASTTKNQTTKASSTSTTSISVSESTAVATTSTTLSTTASTTSTTAKATTTTTSAYIDCTVEIECKKILDNMSNLKAGHEDFVPDDGIILNSYSVTIKNGSTAYDALSEACSANGIKLSSNKSVYGVYVSGINNIDEFDCGKQSGWLYSVNGKSPSKSSDNYKLKNGDKVVFSYTC